MDALPPHPGGLRVLGHLLDTQGCGRIAQGNICLTCLLNHHAWVESAWVPLMAAMGRRCLTYLPTNVGCECLGISWIPREVTRLPRGGFCLTYLLTHHSSIKCG